MELWQIVKDFISEHTELITLASLSFGFIGIILAFIFYRSSKPIRQLSYSTRTFRIISEKAKKVAGLAVKYNGQKVNAISVTRLAIWNGGTEPLRATEISENDPLIIKPIEGVNILKAELIESTSSANKSTIKQTNDESGRYKFCFDFLNPTDGIIASFVHNGTDIKDLSLLGTLIGAKIKRTAADPETVTTSAEPHAATTIMYVESARSYCKFMPLSIIFGSIVFFIISFFTDDKMPLVIAIVGLVTAFGLFFYFKRKYPPSQLKMYDDNL